MGVRDQRIELGPGIKAVFRCVYDIREDDRAKIQIGYVQYDNNEIPVWRPLDPGDKSKVASWRRGTWRNIYALNMKHRKGVRNIEYEMQEVDLDGVSVSLPEVSVEIAWELKNYLNNT